MNAATLRNEATFDSQASVPSRDEVLARYHRLREIGKHHHSEAMDFLSKDAIFEHARRLGLARGKTLVLDSMDQFTMAIDLAIHTSPADRTRAIDRYARSARWAPGSEEAVMLEVMRNARFGVLLAQRPHASVGLIVTEIFREIDLWLVDEGLEKTLPPGHAIATRFYAPGPFVMTAGVGVPVGGNSIKRALESAPQLMRKSSVDLVQDRRFAEAVYRNALEDGTSERIAFRDPRDGDDED
jgi:hypothetical protein